MACGWVFFFFLDHLLTDGRLNDELEIIRKATVTDPDTVQAFAWGDEENHENHHSG